jgi:hypothetical protein
MLICKTGIPSNFAIAQDPESVEKINFEFASMYR